MTSSSRGLAFLILLLAGVALLGPLGGGPPLADHETIVAECARNMRVTGDWVVPQFLGTAFVRKPPLPYWLVGGVSHLFPDEPATQQPVTTAAARLPSALAGLATVLLLWRFGQVMFGRRVGLVTAVIAASSLCFMLYSPNATVEMLLTLCCTWAYLHFWLAVSSETRGKRLLHIYMFYIALGAGMLAKGPAPMAMVALPLAVWWFAHRPLQMLADGGAAALGPAARAFVADFKSRFVEAFTRLHVVPGIFLFAAVFVPWMLAVAARDERAWSLWDWQYLQRAVGDYPDTRPRGPFYYLPLVLGFVAPWTFAVPEGLAALGLRRYAAWRRPLIYCAVWVFVAVAVMSLEPFKKPYYVAPAIPGLLLMLAAPLERFYSSRPTNTRLAWVLWGTAAVGLAVALVAGWKPLQKEAPEVIVTRMLVIGAVASAALLAAGVFLIKGRGWTAFALTAVASVFTFQSIWYTCAPTIANMDKVKALAAALDKAGIPPEAKILWADQRPDARLSFYFGRQSRYMRPPAEIVAVTTDRESGRQRLLEMALSRAQELLRSEDEVYLIIDRDNYDLGRNTFTEKAYLLDYIHMPDEREHKDWMIVSNVPPRAP